MEAKKEDKKFDELKEAERGAKIKEYIPLVKKSVEKELKERIEKSRPLINTDPELGFENSNKFHELKKELEQKNKSIEELTDTLKRLQAEFENYKKRIEKEKIEFVKFATADLITQVLPVLDSFEIALKNTSDKDKFVEGMKIVYAQFYSILETEGLRPIKTGGELFDPYKHEVLMKEASEKPEGMILEEFQKGYMLNEKILRFSKVKISGK